MLKLSSKRQGFTIVELLIVIVVVGILAAISVVAYNGIQQRIQLALVQSDSSSFAKKLEVFKVENENYPTLINDCPSPATGNLCLKPSNESIVLYDKASSTWGIKLTDGYSLGVMAKDRFLYIGTEERKGANEFLQYVDLAPYIDKYGLGKKYKLSLDLKSQNTASNDKIQVYLQNGSGARYNLGCPGSNLTVSTDYSRYNLECTPTVASLGETRAVLAFYGTYGTGNIPVVKNVRFELAG